jgi:hydrogenase maturation protein HypF
VGNDPGGVFIEAQAPTDTLMRFVARLTSDAPRLAAVESVSTAPIAVVPNEDEFVIAASRDIDVDDIALLPPDTATCAECLAEVRDPANRRYGYPFTACTHCGPRFTIVKGLPYDRPDTTMAEFELCEECAAEYNDPSDRRFHAQPVACPNCGPHAWFVSADTTVEGDTETIAAAAQLLKDGRIVAIKGVGGYHLACDARNKHAVRELRHRKQRGPKPFAVMVADVNAALALAEFTTEDVPVLTSPAAPIVIAPVLMSSDALARAVAPHSDVIGVMLAYTPLHQLLFDALAPDVDVLVMTSGNLADEPICIDEAEAESRLVELADGFLHHNRPIYVACDDSVARSKVGPVRRSRGYVPQPIALPFDSRALLAVGGEIKATGGVAQGNHAWLTQHIGDVGSLETAHSLSTALEVLSSLTRTEPEAIVADLHPGYLSQRWASERAQNTGVPLMLVQHHHAHLASLLAEHRMPPDEPVLGFTFDGTGYGLDEAMWGGELLLGSYSRVTRVGSLRPVLLPGGDAATKRPPRIAAAHLLAADEAIEDSHCDRDELAAMRFMLSTGVNCIPTTSVGRLFDAVSSLLEVCHDVAYEGQAAIQLESLARRATDRAPIRLPIDVTDTDPIVLDPSRLFSNILVANHDGVSRSALALAFHEELATAIGAAAVIVRDRTGVNTVGLTGGVFANQVLTTLASATLEGNGFTVLTHHRVPANDGGLALGQLAVAACGGQVRTVEFAGGN